MTKHIKIQGEEDQEKIDVPGAEEPTDAASQPDKPTTPESPDEDDETAKKLHAAEQAAQENYDRLLRVSAEFDNYKKRTAREMQDVVKFAHEKIAADMLTVVDNLERALASGIAQCGEQDPLVQGVSLVLDELLKALDKYHIKPIEALGEPFDPALHQAMMQEPNNDVAPNTVVREMQKGYLIHDRLLRPTLVAVSTAANNSTE